jgi:hypothetical protein
LAVTTGINNVDTTRNSPEPACECDLGFSQSKIGLDKAIL